MGEEVNCKILEEVKFTPCCEIFLKNYFELKTGGDEQFRSNTK